MIKILPEDIDTDKDVFKTYPQLKVPFEDIYKRKGRNRLMWGIILICHPASLYYEMPISDRLYKVSEDHFKDRYFYNQHKDAMDLLIQKFNSLMLTDLRKQLNILRDKSDEKMELIRKLQYKVEKNEKGKENTTPPESIDKLILSQEKMLNLIKKVKKEIEEEEAIGEQFQTQGDVELSMLESGALSIE